jgi:alcohol dehydrogenase
VQAVVVDAFGTAPVLREVPEPSCPPDGVVVRVGACGVCRSDWHGWAGHDATISVPYVPGHEWAGEVVAVGTDVRRWSVGARVTAPFVQACGACQQCAEGEQQVCADQRQPGFTHDGAFADLVVAHRADLNLVAVPDDLDMITAASLGCRFATAYRAVAGHGGIRPGWWVAVHGCGGVGLSAVMIAKALGARVVAVDISERALSAARDLGVDVALDASDGAGSPDAVGAAVRSATGGGANVSLDALGSAATSRASVAGLRPRGRHVQVGLMTGDDARTPLPLDRVLAEELSIVGSHGLAAHDYPELLRLVVDGSLNPRLLVAQTITLDAAPDALVALGSAPAVGGMTVIDLTAPHDHEDSVLL